MKSKSNISFLPFNAVNQFMVDDFKTKVIKSVIFSLDKLPNDIQKGINLSFKRYVKVPGFRNSVKAPPQLKVKPTVEAFEKHPQVVSDFLAAWAATKPELSLQVYNLLVSRIWEILPVDADRAKLPGFIPQWPAKEDFNKLNIAYSEMYPDSKIDEDDVSLMVVWISTRLPIEFVDDLNWG